MENDTIQRGAYLLRLWDTEQVVTSSLAEPPNTGYIDVKNERKKEAVHRERQIWWIERAPGDEEHNEHPTRQKYTITQCGSGRGLVSNGQKASVYGMHGKPEEYWNFVPELPQFPQFRTYSIKGNSDPPWLTASSTEREAVLAFQEKASPQRLQVWELIFPTPSIPTGWFRIRNSTTNATLAHRFTHIPPFLIPDGAHQETAPCNINCCSATCDKASQWAFAHGQLHAPYPFEGDAAHINRYVITNRLTGGFLADRGGSGGPTQVCCWSRTPTQWIEPSFVDNSLWEMQVVAPPHIWGFRNSGTLRMLTEIIDNQYVSCVDRSGGDPQACSRWRVDPLDGHPHIAAAASHQPTPKKTSRGADIPCLDRAEVNAASC
ncbi:hypothetical protein B9Z19DRAFT_1088607 [Tuber borchii]|uniref:Uncharacterized protein n=1 Tax=Tuber borchii TaxID=42251 RepID=A0A2T6ZL90_TUBBO|nr:hypothetical protein B9Z19DRAFT_1088607 [Tuber borchii]